MREKPMRKNGKFYIGMALNILEGMLSGFNFFLLYEVMKMLWIGNVNLSSILRLTLFLAGIFWSMVSAIQKVKLVVLR